MSLVRVTEGDVWVSELPKVPSKSLIPITLVLSTSIHHTGPAGLDLAPNLQGESELIQV